MPVEQIIEQPVEIIVEQPVEQIVEQPVIYGIYYFLKFIRQYNRANC